jgi:uncharacterized protein
MNKIKQWATIVAIAALSTLFSVGSVEAAGFNCDKAAAPLEKLICGDPVLDYLDDRLAWAFKARNGTRDNALLEEQRQWLSSRVSACGVPAAGKDKPSVSLRKSAVRCLAELYGQRLAALGASPPLQLIPSPATDDDIMPLPRIADKTGDPAIKRANQALADIEVNTKMKTLSKDFDDPDACSGDNHSVRLTLVGQRFFGLVSQYLVTCRGAAHPGLNIDVLVLDLKTGDKVNMAKVLPPKLVAGPTDKDSGEIPATKMFGTLYGKEVGKDQIGECSSGFGSFIVWPDAAADAVVADPTGFGHADQAACTRPAPFSTAMLRQLGDNTVLLEEIDHAHAEIGRPGFTASPWWYSTQ